VNEDLTALYANGSICVELGYAPTQPLNVTKLTGTTASVIQSLWAHGINGPCRTSSILISTTPDYHDQLMTAIMATGTPRINVRMTVESSKAPAIWQSHLVTNIVAEPYLDGHRILIETADRLWEITRATKVRARRGRASDIVATIASENSLADLVIEQTDVEGSYIQSNQDDIEFFSRRLLPRAVNAKGRGNYRFYVRNNVFHFHSPDYQAGVKSINYFDRSIASKLTLVDNSQVQIPLGAAGVIGLIHDPYTAVAQAIASDPTKTLNYDKVTPKLTAVQGAMRPLTIHLGTNRLPEATAIVQNTYERAYMSLFELELQLERMPFLELNDMLTIVIQPSNNVSSPWSGTYNVTSVKHNVSRNSLTSQFTLQRGELAALGQNSRGLRTLGDVPLDVKTNFAVGQQVDLSSIRSSELTRGGERLHDGSIVRPVNQSG
jgi:hypothetical protein